MVAKVQAFAEIQDAFFAYVSDIVYATMITVDKKARPRARVLLPIWEVVDDRPVGWLATYKTPVKVAHLARNPHTTLSYWSPKPRSTDDLGRSAWRRTRMPLRSSKIGLV